MDQKTLAEWAQREAEYYADAERWKRIEERMKRQQSELEAEWKRKDTQFEKLFKTVELKKYTQQEINEAIHQLRIERIKVLLKD